MKPGGLILSRNLDAHLIIAEVITPAQGRPTAVATSDGGRVYDSWCKCKGASDSFYWAVCDVPTTEVVAIEDAPNNHHGWGCGTCRHFTQVG